MTCWTWQSKEEHDSSVCLCGSQGCKGSYLCYTGPGAYDEVSFVFFNHEPVDSAPFPQF